MESNIMLTPQERKRMKNFIEQHPIDHAYDDEDDKYDGKIPPDQCLSRDYQRMLQEDDMRKMENNQ